jgi:hypothetical protein
MPSELLKQTDYVIEALSRSKNERHAQEREAALTLMHYARHAATFGPTELSELQPGERRLQFDEFKDLSTFIKSGLFSRLLDTNDLVTRLGFDLKWYVDVVVKSEDRGQGEQ